MPQDTDWLTQQEIATMTGKDIREVREAVRNLRRAGVIQTTVSPEDERLILVHKDSLTVVKSALRATA
jgi:DNA-binding MarR family transcriptional regulator